MSVTIQKRILQALLTQQSSLNGLPAAIATSDVLYGTVGTIDTDVASVIAAQGASTQLAVTTVSIANTGETFTGIQLLSGTTEVRWETIAPSHGGSNLKWELQAPLFLGANLPLSFRCSNSAATVACSATAYVVSV